MGSTHSTFGLLVVMAAAWLCSSAARAEPHKSGRVSSAESCTLSGSAHLGQDVLIYNLAQDGRPIARFTGGSTALRVGPVPLDTARRVPVATGTGSGSFRIDGYVDGLEVPLFTTREVPIVEGHLWIAAEQAVVLLGGAPGRIQVRKDLSRPLSQSFKVMAACDNFALTRGTPPGWSPPGEARGYLVQEDPADLFAAADTGAARVTSLIGARGMLLWSEDRRGAFVHLLYHGEVVINAWGRLRDFRALPPGETSDRLLPASIVSNPPRLALAESPRLVRTKHEVKLRSAAQATAPVIGKIEVDTETYVLDLVAGWASVLPKALNVAPPSDGQFWAKGSELGI